jgi:predicted CoA-binding protein
MTLTKAQFDRLLHPKSVAIVGASEQPEGRSAARYC